MISGTQPSISTLYSKNSEPLFEFGTRYRNTIRVCPFSSAVLIGGFGNLAGEVDFWDLETHKDVGKMKAYCAVGVEWAPDGMYILTSVLYHRVKVDNEVKIYKVNGQAICSLSFKDSELYDASWMPIPKGILKKPNLKNLGVAKEEVKEQKAPKKWFNHGGGGSNTFSQIMKQEMTRSYDTGPKKANTEAYKVIMKEQALQHAESIANPQYSKDVDSPP